MFVYFILSFPFSFRSFPGQGIALSLTEMQSQRYKKTTLMLLLPPNFTAMKRNDTKVIFIRPQWLQFWREILTYREKYLSSSSPNPNKEAIFAEIKKFSRLLTTTSKKLNRAIFNEAAARAAYLTAIPKRKSLFQALSTPTPDAAPVLVDKKTDEITKRYLKAQDVTRECTAAVDAAKAAYRNAQAKDSGDSIMVLNTISDGVVQILGNPGIGKTTSLMFYLYLILNTLDPQVSLFFSWCHPLSSSSPLVLSSSRPSLCVSSFLCLVIDSHPD
jgi:hypothetical protein